MPRKSIEEIARKECSILLKHGNVDDYIFCIETLKAYDRGEYGYSKTIDLLSMVLPLKKAKKVADNFDRKRRRIRG